MIAWAEIVAEYEEAETGFRERVVALFRKYEGQETDEKVRGKVVLVTSASFAKHLGIPKVTFHDWIARGSDVEVRDSNVEPAACVNDGVPPAEGFVVEVTRRITGMLPLLADLSEETHRIIEEDIVALEQAIAQLKAQLKKARSTK